MTFKQHVLEFVVYQLGRRIVIAFYLVADYLNLFVNLVLRVSAVKHDIGKQTDSLGYVLFLYGCVKSGVFFVGKCVQVATQLLQTIDNLQRIAGVGALKRHVLAEVGHAFLARQLMAGAGSYLVAAVNHLCYRWLMYYSKPVR